MTCLDAFSLDLIIILSVAGAILVGAAFTSIYYEIRYRRGLTELRWFAGALRK